MRTDLRQMRLSLGALSHSIRHTDDFATCVKNSPIAFSLEENTESEKILMMSVNLTTHEFMAALSLNFHSSSCKSAKGSFEFVLPLFLKILMGSPSAR